MHAEKTNPLRTKNKPNYSKDGVETVPRTSLYISILVGLLNTVATIQLGSFGNFKLLLTLYTKEQ
jgi:hypothetical protein